MWVFLCWLLILTFISLIVAYFKLSFKIWTAIIGAALIVVSLESSVPLAGLLFFWVLFLAASSLINYSAWRKSYISLPLLRFFKQSLPQLSDTEKIALEAGTIGWEGELFSGNPNWKKLRKQPFPELSAAEKAFIEGPVEKLCSQINEWEISHELADLPATMWNFLKKHKFFGMIIPKEYGGLGFSPYAHGLILQKIACKSTTVSSTVAVPNSLGPAELLMHYGTQEQRDHYLPKLATGESIPCFALTGPKAGSDATSLPDTGVVCKGKWKNKTTIGIKLNFEKRYITLAPVATVIGLAFKLYDPDNLIGEQEDRGITVALLPRDLKGIEIGRRHLALNTPFQNGPIKGRDVFIPLDFIIGGQDMIGQGWRMLVESLAVGRCISLPSSTVGIAKMAALTTGAYARLRKQFNQPIGQFEGIQESLAIIGGLTYSASSLSELAISAIGDHEKPAIPSAISKYQCTELARHIMQHAMDVHAGKAVMLGPSNYLGRFWQTAPFSITVEGANILTRNMIIFGQGVIRCHPYVLKEIEAINEPDLEWRLTRFDDLFFGHIGHVLSNLSRSLLLGVFSSKIIPIQAHSDVRKYYQKASRYSAIFAFITDVSLGLLGGKLKFKERLSARLADALSQLYIISAVLKRFKNDGSLTEDLPLVHWSCQYAFYQLQIALREFIRNFPSKTVGMLIRLITFPLGYQEKLPSDQLGKQIANLLQNDSDTKARLTQGIYRSPTKDNHIGDLEATLKLAIELQPIEKRVNQALKNGLLTDNNDYESFIKLAVDNEIITQEEGKLLIQLENATNKIIATDDFDSDYLAACKKDGK